MQSRQESQLFLYTDAEQENTLPVAVYIRMPRIGSVLCKIERMDEKEISALHEKQQQQTT